MSKKTLNRIDLEFAALNNQEIVNGTSISQKRAGVIYHILAVYGATDANVVTINDKNSVFVLKLDGNKPEYFPIRMDGGFEAIADDAVQVKFCTIIGG